MQTEIELLQERRLGLDRAGSPVRPKPCYAVRLHRSGDVIEASSWDPVRECLKDYSGRDAALDLRLASALGLVLYWTR